MNSVVFFLKGLINPLVFLPSLSIGAVMALFVFFLLRQESMAIANLLSLGLGRSKWLLTRGGAGEYFYDIDKQLADWPNIKNVANLYTEILKQLDATDAIDKIAFIEKDSGPVGALSLKGLLILKTKIPGITIRVRKKIFHSAIKGAQIEQGDNVVIVSDVATTGGSIIQATKIIKKVGGNVSAAIVIFHRGGEEIEEKFREEGIELKYVVTPDLLPDFSVEENEI